METRTVAQGEYTLKTPLGHGQGSVFHAVSTQSGQPVAVRLVRPPSQVIGNLLLERARRAQGIRHEGLANLLDAGQESDGAIYLVSEYVEGPNLVTWADSVGIPPLFKVVEFMQRLCAVLQHAAQHGLSHESLSPHSILVPPGDRGINCKLLDICLPAVGRDAALNLNTAQFLAPEQLRRHFQEEPSLGAVTGAANVYSLGCILYLLCTGGTPYPAKSEAELLERSALRSPADPSRINPQIPPQLKAIILHALSAEPSERYSSVADMAQALSTAVTHRPASATLLQGSRTEERSLLHSGAYNDDAIYNAQTTLSVIGERDETQPFNLLEEDEVDPHERDTMRPTASSPASPDPDAVTALHNVDEDARETLPDAYAEGPIPSQPPIPRPRSAPPPFNRTWVNGHASAPPPPRPQRSMPPPPPPPQSSPRRAPLPFPEVSPLPPLPASSAIVRAATMAGGHSAAPQVLPPQSDRIHLDVVVAEEDTERHDPYVAPDHLNRSQTKKRFKQGTQATLLAALTVLALAGAIGVLLNRPQANAVQGAIAAEAPPQAIAAPAPLEPARSVPIEVEEDDSEDDVQVPVEASAKPHRSTARRKVISPAPAAPEPPPEPEPEPEPQAVPEPVAAQTATAAPPAPPAQPTTTGSDAGDDAPAPGSLPEYPLTATAQPPQSAAPVAAVAPSTNNNPALQSPLPALPKPLKAQAKIQQLEVHGSLATSIVQRALERQVDNFESCYKAAAIRAGRNGFSNLAVEFEVDYRGHAREIKVRNGQLRGLDNCVARVIERVATDRAPDTGAVRTTLKLDLSP